MERDAHQAAWDRYFDGSGTGRPSLAPLRDHTAEPWRLGDYVYLDQPRDPDGFPVVHGVVLSAEPDENGEVLLRIAQHKVRYGRPEMYLKVIRAAEVDRSVTSHSHPTQCSRMAAAICAALAARHERGARWSREDIDLLGAGQLLARENANTW